MTAERLCLRKLQRRARSWPGHPRLGDLADQKTWMAGTSPAMTMRGCALREKISTAVFDFNPTTEYSPSVRSARGRSHEASCGRDRMRRLRACLASTHSGGAGAPPGGHYGLPARELADGGRPQVGRPPQSVPGRRKEERRDGAPRGARVLERERGTTEQWLRHLARHPPLF